MRFLRSGRLLVCHLLALCITLIPLGGASAASVSESTSVAEAWYQQNNGGTVSGPIALPDGSGVTTTCASAGLEIVVNYETPAGQYAFAVVTADGTIRSIQRRGLVSLAGLPAGEYRVWGFNYTGTITGMPGDDVFATQFSTGDWTISTTAVTVTLQSLDAGSIAFADGSTVARIVVDDQPDPLSVVRTNDPGDDGDAGTWVITDDAGTILALPNAPPFDLNGAGTGTCLIWYLTYDEGLTGAAIGGSASDLTGCFDLSNPLTVIRDAAPMAGGVRTGPITATNGGNRVKVCTAGDDPAEGSTVTVAAGYDRPEGQLAYVVTTRDFQILAIGTEPTVDFAAYDPGKYWIWAFNYTGTTTGMPGDNVFSTQFSTEEWLISQTAILVTVEESCTRGRSVVTGPIAASSGQDRVTVCTDADGDGVADGSTITTVLQYQVELGEVAFVVTDASFGITAIASSGTVDFSAYTPGQYWIWAFNYTGERTGMIGDNVFATQFSTEEWLISQTAILVTVGEACAEGGETCTADAGTTSATSATDIQLTDGSATLSATASGATVPGGYTQAYVLTMGEDKVITGLNTTGTFTVDMPGQYRIHSLVAQIADAAADDYLDLGVVTFGTTTAADFLGLVSPVICLSLDAEGASFSVTEEPVQVCTADAGTTTATSATSVELTDGTATLSATATGATVPGGFTQAYVLTMGAGLVIEGFNTTGSFVVDTSGEYRIHSFVAQVGSAGEPDYLDLSVIVTGTTTAAEVLALIDGGLCADLDAAGASFSVAEEPVQVCTADAGTTTATSATSIELTDGTATISAAATGATVPGGYTQAYVLTVGPGLVVEGFNTSGSFVVDTSGDYRIHSFVAQVSSAGEPDYLDLSVIVVGTTTAAEVLALIDGGLCADLDAAGVTFIVTEAPAVCEADAGTTVARSATTVELDEESGEATLSASASGGNVPAGFVRAYVLTEGDDLVVQDFNVSGNFTVTAPGTYRIHAAVASLADLSNPELTPFGDNYEPGVTTVTEVLAFVDRLGLCVGIDLAGVTFTVAEPEPDAPCTADAGTTRATSATVAILADGPATLSGVAVDPTVPAGYSQAYVLTTGDELVIAQYNLTGTFTVAAAGTYTVHSLVAQTSDASGADYFDLSMIQPGTTTAAQVFALISGGLCADLDGEGVGFTVTSAPVDCPAQAGTTGATSATTVELANGMATISAVAQGPTVPGGFVQGYVLTMGDDLRIMDGNLTGSFRVTATGTYRIHTAIINVADIDNPALAPFVDGFVAGTTTLGEVLQLASANALCTGVDIDGARFTVIDNVPGFQATPVGPRDVMIVLQDAVPLSRVGLPAHIRVSDAQGTVVFSRDGLVEGQLDRSLVNLAEVPAGLYYLTVVRDGHTSTQRVLLW